MARLNPHEILKADSVYGHKPDPIIRMLGHYGFERANDGHTKHLKFKHPKHSGIPFVTIPKGNSLDVASQQVVHSNLTD